jgi:alpha-methylacyl-CoA racemase
MHAAMAILAALVRRATTGAGEYLDVSVADGVVALMSLAIDEYLATGEVPGPRHGLLTGRYACYDVYECADGRWLSVAAIEPRFWANLCRLLGCERWIPSQTNDAHQAAIRIDLRAAFATHDRDHWVGVLGPADTCVAAVASIPEVVADPHLQARHTFVEAQRTAGAPFRQVGWVLAGMDRDQPAPVVRDASITDTDALLRDAGLDEATLRTLRAEGVVA